jgi:hypothetical protein
VGCGALGEEAGENGLAVQRHEARPREVDRLLEGCGELIGASPRHAGPGQAQAGHFQRHLRAHPQIDVAPCPEVARGAFEHPNLDAAPVIGREPRGLVERQPFLRARGHGS